MLAVTTMHVAGTCGAATVYAGFRNGTMPFALCPCLSSSVHHAACIKRAGLDLMKLATSVRALAADRPL